jgi:Holliday junction resolvase RusA-like endonuclease
MAQPIISIDFPVPPSANAMYSVGISKITRKPAVFKSTRYRQWIKEAGQTVMVSGVMRGVKPISGKFKAIITVDQQLSKADCDNLTKPVMDLAQRLNIITNDKNSEHVGTGWGTAPLGCRLTIIPVEEDKDAA